MLPKTWTDLIWMEQKEKSTLDDVTCNWEISPTTMFSFVSISFQNNFSSAIKTIEPGCLPGRLQWQILQWGMFLWNPFRTQLLGGECGKPSEVGLFPWCCSRSGLLSAWCLWWSKGSLHYDSRNPCSLQTVSSFPSSISVNSEWELVSFFFNTSLILWRGIHLSVSFIFMFRFVNIFNIGR